MLFPPSCILRSTYMSSLHLFGAAPDSPWRSRRSPRSRAYSNGCDSLMRSYVFHGRGCIVGWASLIRAYIGTPIVGRSSRALLRALGQLTARLKEKLGYRLNNITHASVYLDTKEKLTKKWRIVHSVTSRYHFCQIRGGNKGGKKSNVQGLVQGCRFSTPF